MKVLVTGGAGYIGSHAVLKLIEAGYQVLIVDNFETSSPDSIDRLEKIAGESIPFTRVDLRDCNSLDEVFQRFKQELVMHLAGLKSVSESIENPLIYYDVNVVGTLNLLKAMSEYGCRQIVFSSSATVYGLSTDLPYTEQHLAAPINAYGSTKLCCETLISDWSISERGRCAVLLRYFNPIGAHSSGAIGESPKGTPNNLMPYVLQVAGGQLPMLTIHGNDFDTTDGTGERDYIHVEDLAEAHIYAAKRSGNSGGAEVYNVGTGRSYSVLDIVNTFEKVNRVSVPFKFGPKRLGDAPRSVACVAKIESVLGWRARFSLDEMVASSWNWHVKNPFGLK